METSTSSPIELATVFTSGNGTIEARFGWIDYSFFSIVLSLSTCIGLYFGCFGNKQSTTVDYLHGGKNMNFIPVAISHIASHLSGITLLGIPAEIYSHGTQYWSCVFTSAVLTVLATVYISLPVFYKLQLTNCYEYITLRFDERVTKVASLLFLIGGLIHLPIVVYIPALAFNQVSGISMYITAPIVCSVCIFYTTIGGIKAVIWSDAIQFTVTFFTLLIIFILGTISVGGFQEIWRIAEEHDRIEFFNMNLDPTIRTTFWTIALGNSITWITNNAFNAGAVQKFMAVPKYSDAVKIILVFGLGTVITKCLSCFSGLMMFAKYHDCDPFMSKKIIKNDQLLPYFILDVAGYIPGIAGLFIAGVFSTALSTMASALNTIAGTVYKNFIVIWMPKSTSEQTASNIMKLIVIVSGVIISALVFVVDKLGAVLQVSMSFHGITTGTSLALFLLGMLFPTVNATGAFWGAIMSLLISAVIAAGTQVYTYQGKLKFPPLSASVEGCDPPFNASLWYNSTILNFPAANNEDVFWPFRISFYYYPLIGLICAIVIALIVSHFTRKDDEEPVSLDLLNPYIHRFLSDKHVTNIPVKYASIDRALELTTLEDKIP